MASAFKSLFGLGGRSNQPQQAPVSFVLPTKESKLPSTAQSKPMPVADDKASEISERKRAQKLYAGRGRQGSVLGASEGDSTYG